MLYGAPEPAALAHGLGLAQVLVEGLRAHASSERRVLVAAGVLYVSKQRIHENNCTTC